MWSSGFAVAASFDPHHEKRVTGSSEYFSKKLLICHVRISEFFLFFFVLSGLLL